MHVALINNEPRAKKPKPGNGIISRWMRDLEYSFQPYLGGCSTVARGSDLPLLPAQILTLRAVLSEQWIA